MSDTEQSNMLSAENIFKAQIDNASEYTQVTVPGEDRINLIGFHLEKKPFFCSFLYQ